MWRLARAGGEIRADSGYNAGLLALQLLPSVVEIDPRVAARPSRTVRDWLLGGADLPRTDRSTRARCARVSYPPSFLIAVGSGRSLMPRTDRSTRARCARVSYPPSFLIAVGWAG
jgi:hypothetical protein